MNRFIPRRVHVNQGPAAPRPWLCRIYLAARPARLLAAKAAICFFGALIGIAIILPDATAQPAWQLVFYGFSAACGIMACCDILLGDIAFWLIMESLRVVNRLIDEADTMIDGHRVKGSSLKLMGSKAAGRQVTIICASENGGWVMIRAHQTLGTALPGIEKYQQIPHDEAVAILGEWKQLATSTYL